MNNQSIWGGQENILPEAANLFAAMRSMGYEDTAAVADLIDNSIDAKANNIWITIDENLDRIFIADDGVGMSMETLNTAAKLGGKKNHNDSDDLGKYGLGLITASLSMGRTIRIITKNEGEYNTAILSYDKIQETNKFIADFHKSIGTEKISFDFRTHNADSGTVLIIDDCDHIQSKTAKSFATNLNNTISETFRAFISEGKRIFINGTPVEKEDPLYLNYPGTKILVDEDIDIKMANGAISKMHVKAAKIHDFGSALNKKQHINIHRQGFYVLRNSREVAAALEYPEIYKKHNDFNFLRIELSFNSELDDMMGVNIRKHNIAPAQSIINSLKMVLDEPIKKLRLEMKEKQKGGATPSPFPPAPAPAPAPTPQPQPGPEPAHAPEPGEGGPVQPEPRTNDSYSFEIMTRAAKETDPLFEASVSNNRVSIRYNVKNVFFLERIVEDASGPIVKEVLDSAIKSSIKALLDSDKNADVSSFASSLAKNIAESEE